MALRQETLDLINKRVTGGSKEKAVRMLTGEPEEVDVIPTGSLRFDAITGVGGYPLGRIIELSGPESSSKTTATIHAMAEAQKMGYNVGFIDFEQAFDRKYAENLGVDPDSLAISQPETTEEGLNTVDAMLDTGEFNLIIVDSTNAMTPKAELEGDMEDTQMGLNARLLAKGLRKITAKAKSHNCTIIFISQLREKLGISYGSNKVIGVGNALKFYCSMRFEFRKKSTQKDKDGKAVLNTMAYKCSKNKLAAPFGETEIDVRFGEGFDRVNELLSLAVEQDIVNKSGSWYSYSDTKLGQGSEKVVELLKDNPELIDEIEAKVLEQWVKK